jgi:cobalt-zinc-cadmium efflux system membrane fusion protein
MKKKFLFPLILILAMGVVVGRMILNMDTAGNDPHAPALAPGEANSIARGPHGGWLFSKNGLQVEVEIFETGIPPQFRVYVADVSGKTVPLNEVDRKSTRLNSSH